jgi:hypothetical protein
MGLGVRGLCRLKKRHTAGAGNPTNPHSYFDQLVASDYHYRSWHLRTQAQVRSVAKLIGNRTNPVDTNYIWPNDDFADKQDAAKIIVPAGVANYEQLWMPLAFSANNLTVDQASLMVTWDFYWDISFYTEHVGTLAQTSAKAFQFRRTSDNIYFELRNRFMNAITDPTKISYFDVRAYNEFRPVDLPNGIGGSFDDGPTSGINYGNDTLGLFQNEWQFAANTWTRFWVTFTSTNGSTRVSNINVWIADENRDATQILSNVTGQLLQHDDLTANGAIHHFDIEYNYSQGRAAGPWIGYVRNVVALRDVPDYTVYLQRPIR